MKCPCCSETMHTDNHRKIELLMCYECGYIEGRRIEPSLTKPRATNFERLAALNLNEAAAFVANSLALDEDKIKTWLGRSIA